MRSDRVEACCGAHKRKKCRVAPRDRRLAHNFATACHDADHETTNFTLQCARSCSKYSWEPWIHRRCPRRAGPGVGPSTCNCIARRCATSRSIAGAAGLIAPLHTRLKSSVRDPSCARPPYARGGGKGGATTGSSATSRTARKISARPASTRRNSATGTRVATAERAVCVDTRMEKPSSEPRAMWRPRPWKRCRQKFGRQHPDILHASA